MIPDCHISSFYERTIVPRQGMRRSAQNVGLYQHLSERWVLIYICPESDRWSRRRERWTPHRGMRYYDAPEAYEMFSDVQPTLLESQPTIYLANKQVGFRAPAVRILILRGRSAQVLKADSRAWRSRCPATEWPQMMRPLYCGAGAALRRPGEPDLSCRAGQRRTRRRSSPPTSAGDGHAPARVGREPRLVLQRGR
jgi:hypothetical protein